MNNKSTRGTLCAVKDRLCHSECTLRLSDRLGPAGALYRTGRHSSTHRQLYRVEFIPSADKQVVASSSAPTEICSAAEATLPLEEVIDN